MHKSKIHIKQVERSIFVAYITVMIMNMRPNYVNLTIGPHNLINPPTAQGAGQITCIGD